MIEDKKFQTLTSKSSASSYPHEILNFKDEARICNKSSQIRSEKKNLNVFIDTSLELFINLAGQNKYAAMNSRRAVGYEELFAGM